MEYYEIKKIKKRRLKSKRFHTKVNIKKRKTNIKNSKKLSIKNSRKYLLSKSPKTSVTNRFNLAKKEKFIKSVSVFIGLFIIVTVFFIILFLRYIQNVNNNLPSPDDPFRGRNQTSIIYASNVNPNTGYYQELYKVFNTENRISVKMDEVPDVVIWTTLAAEDINFYEHKGFDLKGIVKAIAYNYLGIGEMTGGSTITQQLIKQTTLGDENSIDRKLKEILMSIQVERTYSKDEILEMYLNVNNYGSNIYGIKTAAKFYFNKNLNDLTLAEAAVLARIPQNPVFNSPTLSPDINQGRVNAENGRQYVLDQMQKYIAKINEHIVNTDYLITDDDILSARNEIITYQDPKIDITAPHFVFYIEKILTTEPYNNGKPFTLAEIQTGGYRIYTTLDTEIQKIAEEEVSYGVEKYSNYRNGKNGAVLITRPRTGDIVAMVGSKSFTQPDEGTMFNPQVNVTDSLQSMGSTMKPFAYYKAFETGVSSPGAYLPDIPIKFGDYTPRNWDGKFKGATNGATARRQLAESRNLPAVTIVDMIGVNTYINTLIDFGYETIENNKTNYGHSLVLGGGEVTMIEHAQGYGIFANSGDLVKLNPIQKITKYDSKTGSEVIVYEKSVEKTNVADSKAIYLVNHILNYKNGGPGGFIDGRDFAGKTGTTDNHMDTIYVGYSPDIVIVGWNGNNDNTPMIANSWGENVTKPWVIELGKKIAAYFPDRTPFIRPGGIVAYKNDLIIEGKIPDSKLLNKYLSQNTQLSNTNNQNIN